MTHLKARIFGLAVLSSLAMGLALPNMFLHYGNPLIGPICLVPYFSAVMLAPSRRFAVRLGAVFGVTQSLMTNFWLAFFHGFTIWTVSGVAIGMGLYFMLFTPFFYTFRNLSPRYRPLVFAAMWTVYEYIKSIGFLGFPWGLVAYPVGGVLPLVQIADITGVWGVSYLMALLNAMFTESLERWRLLPTEHAHSVDARREGWLLRPGDWAISRLAVTLREDMVGGWAFGLFLVAGFLVYGFIRMSIPLPVKDHLKVVLVQQNTNSWLAGPATERRMLLRGERLSKEGLKASGGKADLVVWSEESLLRPYRYYKDFYAQEPPSDPFLTFLKRTKTPLLIGAPYVLSFREEKVLNASLLLDPNGKLLDHYGKRHLVPFAEYIPFWNVPFVRTFMQNVVGVQGVWTPGDKNTVFSLHLPSGKTVRFGTPICFEDGFANIARGFLLAGADLLINLTNTSWSNTVSAETQQFAAARFVSIETNRVMIRSTDSGVTSIIGPWGNVLASIPLFKPDYLAADVPVYGGKQLSPYTLYGDYLPHILAVVLFVVLLYVSGSFRRWGWYLRRRGT